MKSSKALRSCSHSHSLTLAALTGPYPFAPTMPSDESPAMERRSASRPGGARNLASTCRAAGAKHNTNITQVQHAACDYPSQTKERRRHSWQEGGVSISLAGFVAVHAVWTIRTRWAKPRRLAAACTQEHCLTPSNKKQEAKHRATPPVIHVATAKKSKEKRSVQTAAVEGTNA